MVKAQDKYKKLNKKMVKSYFGNLLRNIFRRICNTLAKVLYSLANKLVAKERNPKSVLKNYDKIAGEYVRNYIEAFSGTTEMLALENNKIALIKKDVYFAQKAHYVAHEIFSLPEISSVIEIGAGEATTLAPALAKCSVQFDRVAALDLSWSRMAFAKSFSQALNVKIDHFVVGNAYNLPFADNSFDLVYSYHCLEQMPSNKEQSIAELFRIARKYLVLVEPSYELGNWPQKLRWRNKNYIRGIPKTLKKLGLNLLKHERVPYTDYPNSAAIHVIEKKSSEPKVQNIFVCPETHHELTLTKGHYFCEKNGVVYPIIDDIALLDQQNAIIASKFADKIECNISKQH